MAISKVVYGGNTLLDISEDNVTPNTLLYGATAHAANGEQIQGAVVTAEIDDTLSNTGEAADAKATGDALALKANAADFVAITTSEIDSMFA